jgi:cell division septum initiation protein DivIVA
MSSEQRSFDVVRRGYDIDQVEKFLVVQAEAWSGELELARTRIAALEEELRRLHGVEAEAMELRHRAESMGAELAEAEQARSTMLAQAGSEAQQIRTEAQREASKLRHDAELARARIEAEARHRTTEQENQARVNSNELVVEAERIMAEAVAEANRIRTEASTEADRVRDSVDTEVSARVDARLTDELAGLEERRRKLDEDYIETKSQYERVMAAMSAKVSELRTTHHALITGLQAIAKGGLSQLPGADRDLPTSIGEEVQATGSEPPLLSPPGTETSDADHAPEPETEPAEPETDEVTADDGSDTTEGPLETLVQGDRTGATDGGAEAETGTTDGPGGTSELPVEPETETETDSAGSEDRDGEAPSQAAAKPAAGPGMLLEVDGELEADSAPDPTTPRSASGAAGVRQDTEARDPAERSEQPESGAEEELSVSPSPLLDSGPEAPRWLGQDQPPTPGTGPAAHEEVVLEVDDGTDTTEVDETAETTAVRPSSEVEASDPDDGPSTGPFPSTPPLPPGEPLRATVRRPPSTLSDWATSAPPSASSGLGGSGGGGRWNAAPGGRSPAVEEEISLQLDQDDTDAAGTASGTDAGDMITGNGSAGGSISSADARGGHDTRPGAENGSGWPVPPNQSQPLEGAPPMPPMPGQSPPVDKPIEKPMVPKLADLPGPRRRSGPATFDEPTAEMPVARPNGWPDESGPA